MQFLIALELSMESYWLKPDRHAVSYCSRVIYGELLVIYLLLDPNLGCILWWEPGSDEGQDEGGSILHEGC